MPNFYLSLSIQCPPFTNLIWALNLPCYLSFFISFQSLNSIACKFRTPKEHKSLSTGTQHTNKIPLQTHREPQTDSREQSQKLQQKEEEEAQSKKPTHRKPRRRIQNQLYLSIYLIPPYSFLCYPPSLSLFITEKDKEKEKEREISFVILHCPLCSGQGNLPLVKFSNAHNSILHLLINHPIDSHKRLKSH